MLNVNLVCDLCIHWSSFRLVVLCICLELRGQVSSFGCEKGGVIVGGRACPPDERYRTNLGFRALPDPRSLTASGNRLLQLQWCTLETLESLTIGGRVIVDSVESWLAALSIRQEKKRHVRAHKRDNIIIELFSILQNLCHNIYFE